MDFVLVFLNSERKKLKISQKTCWMYSDFAWLLAHSRVNLGVWGCEGMSLHAEAGLHRGCDVQQIPIPGAGRQRVTGKGTAAALPAPCSREEQQLLCWECQPGC